VDAGTTAGLVGTGIGLIAGLVQYRIACAVMHRIVMEAEDEEPVDDDNRSHALLASARRSLFIGTVVVFPVAGFLIGRHLGSS